MNDRIGRRELIERGLVAAGGLVVAGGALAQTNTLRGRRTRRVVVWSEGTAPKNVYPSDINSAIAEGLSPLSSQGWDVSTASIWQPDQGLPEDVLDGADVLIWWGHQRHGDVKDELVSRIVKRVKDDGMGFIATHSAHYSKPLKSILGTPCGWQGGYIEDGSRVDLIVKAPRHPIARGVKDFTVPHTERYGDPFEVPKPETLIFDGTYTLPNGTKQNAQQGMTWTVGKGRVFYFQPGHETYPIYFQPEIQRVFQNGVRWAAR
jgi:trehalose utilization protein